MQVNTRPSGPFREGNVRRPNRDKNGLAPGTFIAVNSWRLRVITEAPAKQSQASADRHSALLQSLAEFTKEHRAARWSGTFGEFLQRIFPADARNISRSSHQYTVSYTHLTLPTSD